MAALLKAGNAGMGMVHAQGGYRSPQSPAQKACLLAIWRQGTALRGKFILIVLVMAEKAAAQETVLLLLCKESCAIA